MEFFTLVLKPSRCLDVDVSQPKAFSTLTVSVSDIRLYLSPTIIQPNLTCLSVPDTIKHTCLMMLPSLCSRIEIVLNA